MRISTLVLCCFATLAAGQTVDTTERSTHEYWEVQYRLDSPDASAYTWTGAKDGELGDSPTPADADAMLVVYYKAIEGCAAEIHVLFGAPVESVQTVSLQAGRSETVTLRADAIGENLTRAVVGTDAVTAVLSAMGPGTGADAEVVFTNGTRERFNFSLLGFRDSTAEASGHCSTFTESIIPSTENG
jgi:hypothetical protein